MMGPLPLRRFFVAAEGAAASSFSRVFLGGILVCVCVCLCLLLLYEQGQSVKILARNGRESRDTQRYAKWKVMREEKRAADGRGHARV
jgi:hypothetical protein